MTTRIAALLAAGFLALGILVGSAGAVLVRDATTPSLADHMADMSGMMAMMGGSSMMGGGSISPQEHAGHHASPTVEPTR